MFANKVSCPSKCPKNTENRRHKEEKLLPNLHINAKRRNIFIIE